MILIGEKINASRGEVARAMRSRDADAILNLAKAQRDAGADVIDVNAGDPEADKTRRIADMRWTVELIQREIDLPLVIDSDDGDALAVGLSEAKRHIPWVNSINAEAARLERTLPIVANAPYPIVALCMGDDGMPSSIEQRIGYAEKIMNACAKAGVAPTRLYFDPIVVPIGVETEAGMMILHTIRKIKTEFPGANTVVGLSNISFGLPARATMNAAFLALSMGAGLDAAIMDPTNVEVMSVFRAADAIMGGDEYCGNFLRHFRECQGRKS